MASQDCRRSPPTRRGTPRLLRGPSTVEQGRTRRTAPEQEPSEFGVRIKARERAGTLDVEDFWIVRRMQRKNHQRHFPFTNFNVSQFCDLPRPHREICLRKRVSLLKVPASKARVVELADTYV